jgi:RNA polymerase sigma factor (sigma-70 family)
MATAQRSTLLWHIHKLTADCGGRQWTDRELLDEFVGRGSEAAFAALVPRHGPMVLRAARRVLRHEQDAEDAFQATFLVLARGARSVRRGEAVASWLHGVAYRTAMKAKRSAARRRDHEARRRAAAPPAAPGPTWDEVQAALDEEIQRLPEPHRAAFVLCVLEGKSRPEVAAELGVKEGTVWSRLTRARQQLQRRLTRRGIQLSALLAALSLVESAGEAGAPAALAHAAIRSGLSVAAGEPAAGVIPTHVAALAAGVTRAMFLTKAKIALAVLLALTVIAAGAGVLAHQALAAREQPAGTQKPEAGSRQPGPAAAKPAAADEKGERVEVSGRVFDPDGRPVAGAKVVLQQRRPNQELPDFFPAPATGTTGADGRFRFSGNVHLNAPIRNYPPMLTLTAHVPGYGPAAVETTSGDELKDRTLRLVKDDVPIRGRILNLEGRPIAGVTVRPIAVIANVAGDLGRLIKAIETNTSIWADLPNDFRPNIVFSVAAAGLTQTTRTDNEGKFTLSGFGRERIVVLRLDGPAIETCLLNAMTRTGPTVRATRPRPNHGGGFPMPPKRLHEPPATYVYTHGNPFDFVPGPALVVEGTVRDQDTGKPIAGVVVRHGIGHDFGYNFGWAQEELTTTTDAGGNYRLAGLSRPTPQAYQAIQFIPPRGQPYLPAGLSPQVPAFGKPAKLDVGLKRGVLVKGRVMDKATGQPVQAVVEYFAFADNPNLRGIKGFASSRVVSSKKDGSFTLAALRGRGIVAVETDEMRRETYLRGQGVDAISGPRDMQIESFVTRPYMCKFRRFNTLVGIEPDAKAESVACDLQLDPGKTVKGTVLDPDGKPLTGVSIRGPFLSLKSIRDMSSAEFAIPAVNPRKPEAYFFEHGKRNLAAAVILKGDEAAGFTVKLKPTATITGRIVTEKGEPVDKYYFSGRLETGQFNMTRDWNGFFWGRTDAKGWFMIEGLLAGVKLGAQTQAGNLFEGLTLKPGEVRNLGDIKVKTIPE